jgi:hypothetical protein
MEFITKESPAQLPGMGAGITHEVINELRSPADHENALGKIPHIRSE